MRATAAAIAPFSRRVPRRSATRSDTLTTVITPKRKVGTARRSDGTMRVLISVVMSRPESLIPKSKERSGTLRVQKIVFVTLSVPWAFSFQKSGRS